MTFCLPVDVTNPAHSSRAQLSRPRLISPEGMGTTLGGPFRGQGLKLNFLKQLSWQEFDMSLNNWIPYIVMGVTEMSDNNSQVEKHQDAKRDKKRDIANEIYTAWVFIHTEAKHRVWKSFSPEFNEMCYTKQLQQWESLGKVI